MRSKSCLSCLSCLIASRSSIVPGSSVRRLPSSFLNFNFRMAIFWVSKRTATHAESNFSIFAHELDCGLHPGSPEMDEFRHGVIDKTHFCSVVNCHSDKI